MNYPLTCWRGLVCRPPCWWADLPPISTSAWGDGEAFAIYLWLRILKYYSGEMLLWLPVVWLVHDPVVEGEAPGPDGVQTEVERAEVVVPLDSGQWTCYSEDLNPPVPWFWWRARAPPHPWSRRGRGRCSSRWICRVSCHVMSRYVGMSCYIFMSCHVKLSLMLCRYAISC